MRKQNLAHQLECASPAWLPPSLITRSASARAASTHCTSFIVTSACSGVSVR